MTKYNSEHTHARAETVMHGGFNEVYTVSSSSEHHTHMIADMADEVDEENGVYALVHDHIIECTEECMIECMEGEECPS